jgi:hypothetical protein
LDKLSSGFLEVVLGGNDVMVNSKVRDEVVLIMLIHVGLKLLASGSLGLEASWEVGRVASWDGSLLSKLSTCLLKVVLGGDDVVINSKVWNEIVFIMLVHVSLEFLVSSGLGLQTSWEVSTVASWDGLLLGEFATSFLEVVLCSDDIMVNTEVWDEIVLIVFIHVSLELLVGGGLGLQASWEISTVASWDRSLLSKLSSGFLEVILGGNNIMVYTEVRNEVVLIMLIHISLEFLISSCLSLEAFWEISTITSWN